MRRKSNEFRHWDSIEFLTSLLPHMGSTRNHNMAFRPFTQACGFCYKRWMLVLGSSSVCLRLTRDFGNGPHLDLRIS